MLGSLVFGGLKGDYLGPCHRRFRWPGVGRTGGLAAAPSAGTGLDFEDRGRGGPRRQCPVSTGSMPATAPSWPYRHYPARSPATVADRRRLAWLVGLERRRSRIGQWAPPNAASIVLRNGHARAMVRLVHAAISFYLGQLEDDMADLLPSSARRTLLAPLTLLGHSAGGKIRAAGRGITDPEFVHAHGAAPRPIWVTTHRAASQNAGGWASPDVPSLHRPDPVAPSRHSLLLNRCRPLHARWRPTRARSWHRPIPIA